MKDWDEMSEREKDAWLAEHLFKWTIETGTAWGKPDDFDEDDPLVRVEDYTTDLSAAWKVVEKVREKHGMRIYVDHIGTYDVYVDPQVASATSTSVSDAICHAAYLATRHQQMRELAHEIADRNAGAMRRLAEGD